MKLVDFNDDPTWQNLRQKMGADSGSFELYDPERHLSHQELRQLAEQGLVINASRLMLLKDRTLAHKNRRVWICLDQPLSSRWHVSNCSEVSNWRHKNNEVVASISTDVPEVKDAAEAGICMACLAELGYQGIDSRRIRRVDFAEQVMREFRLEAFFREYPSDWALAAKDGSD